MRRPSLGMILYFFFITTAQAAAAQGVIPPAPAPVEVPLRPVIVEPALAPDSVSAPAVAPVHQPQTIFVEGPKPVIEKLPFKEEHPKIYKAYRKARAVVVAMKPFVEVAGAGCNIFILAFGRAK